MTYHPGKAALVAFNSGKQDVFYSFDALAVAAYVAELEGRLEKAEGNAGAALHRSLTLAARATTAEAALAEASKVIEPFAKLAGEPITITAHGSTRSSIDTDNFVAAREWLQANKGDA
jgi:hypothetical protein